MSKIKVLHISKTFLAGSPIRIVQCLNKYSDKIEARLITGNKFSGNQANLKYDIDMMYNPKRIKEYQTLFNSSDLIHLHNRRDPIFVPENYILRTKKGIFHHHSPPNSQTKEEQCKNYLSQCVVAQYQAKMYPNSIMLPNMIDIYDELYFQEDMYEKRKGKLKVFFALGAISNDKYHNKARKEVIEVLERLRKDGKIEYKFFTNSPHEELMREKIKYDVCIDDIGVSGSYHISSIEAWAMGMIPICYINSDVKKIMKYTTRIAMPKYISAKPDTLKKELISLAEDKKKDKSKFIMTQENYRKYCEKAFDPKKLVKFYEDYYESLLENKNFNKCKTFNNLE